MKRDLCKLDAIPESGLIIVPFIGREIHIYRVAGNARAVANV